MVARLTQILFRSVDFRVCPGLSTRLQASRLPGRPGVSAGSAPAPPLPEAGAARGGLPFPETAAFAPGASFRISGGFFARVSGFSSGARLYFLSTLFLLLLRIKLLYFLSLSGCCFPERLRACGSLWDLIYHMLTGAWPELVILNFLWKQHRLLSFF